ncbi:MAG: hypothetical protein IKP73_19865 [Bacteroidales bacterium]|nr:hypothetical protein [Bacteroidales bacterium]
MKYRIITSKRFDKDFKRCIKRGYDMAQIREVMLKKITALNYKVVIFLLFIFLTI